MKNSWYWLFGSSVPDPGCEISQTDLGEGIWLVKLRGSLDMTTAPVLSTHFERLRPDSKEVRVDLKELDFLDSIGLTSLIAEYNERRLQGQRFSLICGEPEKLPALEHSGFGRLALVTRPDPLGA
jgi:anti-anti-sigma factor